MMAGHSKWRWTVCVALAAATAAAQVPAHAQPKTTAGTSPAAARALVPPPAPEQTKLWSLDDALPANSPAAQSQETKTAPPAKRVQSKSQPEKPGLGRLPLSNGAGSFGIETETKVKTTAFPDGRPAPGVETTQRRPPSYFGLSISVPTTDK